MTAFEGFLGGERGFVPSRQFGPTLLVHPWGKPGKIPKVISIVSIIAQGGVCLGGWREKPIIS